MTSEIHRKPPWAEQSSPLSLKRCSAPGVATKRPLPLLAHAVGAPRRASWRSVGAGLKRGTAIGGSQRAGIEPSSKRHQPCSPSTAPLTTAALPEVESFAGSKTTQEAGSKSCSSKAITEHASRSTAQTETSSTEGRAQISAPSNKAKAMRGCALLTRDQIELFNQKERHRSTEGVAPQLDSAKGSEASVLPPRCVHVGFYAVDQAWSALSQDSCASKRLFHSRPPVKPPSPSEETTR